MLPQIQLPKYNTTLPLSQDKVSYRGFTVKEEKILLLAKEADTATAMMESILQIIDNCTFGALDLNKINITDLEYLFLQIRIKSVGEISELSYVCLNEVFEKTCNAHIPVNVDLTKIVPTEFDKKELKIKLTDTIGIQFRLPTVDDSLHIIVDMDKKQSIADTNFLYCILDFIWDGDEIYPANEISVEEFDNFLEGLDSTTFEKLNNFVSMLPSLKTKIDTKCPKCGKESVLTLEGLTDFFQ